MKALPKSTSMIPVTHELSTKHCVKPSDGPSDHALREVVGSQTKDDFPKPVNERRSAIDGSLVDGTCTRCQVRWCCLSCYCKVRDIQLGLNSLTHSIVRIRIIFHHLSRHVVILMACLEDEHSPLVYFVLFFHAVMCFFSDE